MRLFAIDTSSSSLSAAIIEDDAVVGEFGLHTGLQHSEVFLPLVDQLLQAARLSLAEMDAFAVTVGPGSFTGLRIGLATVKAWVCALHKPLLAVSSLEALAATAAEAGALVCPLLDARRDEVYSALFRDGARLMEDCAIGLPALAERLRAYDEPLLLCGDALSSQGAALRELLGPRMRMAAAQRRLFCAAAAGLIAADLYRRRQFSDAASLEPHYIRLPEPEQKKLEQQKGQHHGA